MNKWLVERFIVFEGGTRVVMPYCVRDTEASAKLAAAEASGDEEALAHARLTAVSGGKAKDLGMSAADFLFQVVGIRDIGFQVVPVQSGEVVKL